ncbi:MULTISPECIES: RusA family crossover junction endodeoxyribonuclease [Pseudomonas]|uniref:RusA family crossover junction endodeoxyribonuclease n=1 Tax=Pseudomonas TaxID=286 RepID=UPI000DADF169|nr:MULTISPECIES: RusA family crossover junction endodeoxyribonuclease [unclassified Pseudomonas]RAH04260.1 hypothetical protein DJ480_00530 [Pseudomonas sp. Leaf98]
MMTIPINFKVLGSPSSVNGTALKKNAWKVLVSAAAGAAVSSKFPGAAGCPRAVTVKVFFFPINNQYIDVDNGLKHTIDALSPSVILNDKAVFRIITERFLPLPKNALLVSVAHAAEIAEAMMIANGTARSAKGKLVPKQHVTTIKVEDYLNTNGSYW